MISFRRSLKITADAALTALAAILCVNCGGGGGGGGGATTTSPSITSVQPIGAAIPLASGAPWHGQFLNGERIVCGVFAGQAGVYINNGFKPMPQAGGSGYVPEFLAGHIVYGTYSGGNFSWNLQTNAVADTGSKVAVAVSPDGTYVAFQTAGTGSVLDVSTNTEVALPVVGITAVSDSGSGVCQLAAGSASYRFNAIGAISHAPLASSDGSTDYTIKAAIPDGVLAGEYNGLPGLWQPTSTRPTALGIPGGPGGAAATINTGGAVGGWYQPTAGSGGFALLWPLGPHSPSVFVDINGQFPLAGGAILSGIYALDPNSLNFIGLVTNADGSLSIQAFAVN